MLWQWLKVEILEYLEQWEKAVDSREGFGDEAKSSMLLSSETSTGIKLTGETRYVAS